MATFAERLKELRAEKDLTQKQLGQEIGVDRVTINRWERENNPPVDENLSLLAQYFNTSTLYLLGVVDDRNMVFEEGAEETEEIRRKADEDMLLGVYRMLSPEMKRFVHSMARNALYVEREKEGKMSQE